MLPKNSISIEPKRSISHAKIQAMDVLIDPKNKNPTKNQIIKETIK